MENLEKLEISNLEIFEKLLNDFKTITFPEVKNPTYLEILKLNRREVAWSNLLIFFFDPTREHQLKELFIRSFLQALDERVEIGNINQIKVFGEVNTFNRKRIDLVIQAEHFIAGIENKVDFYCDNPLEIYSLKIDELAENKKSLKVILSLNHCNESNGFKNLRYDRFVTQIQQNLSDYKKDTNPIYLTFLEDFLNNINKTIKFYAMQKNEEAIIFFRDNKENIEKLLPKYNEFKLMVNKWFEEVYENLRFEDERVAKAEIEDTDTPTFWITAITPNNKIMAEIYLTNTYDIYCYIIGYPHELELDILSDVKSASTQIVNFFNQAIKLYL